MAIRDEDLPPYLRRRPAPPHPLVLDLPLPDDRLRPSTADDHNEDDRATPPDPFLRRDGAKG
jgi:hypothetical protein